MRKKTVAGSGGSGESPSMAEQPENYEPTKEDIDMIVEDVTGKPVKPANLADGIASMRQRIAQFEDHS